MITRQKPTFVKSCYSSTHADVAPLQGASFFYTVLSQGVALGYGVAPQLRGEVPNGDPHHSQG